GDPSRVGLAVEEGAALRALRVEAPDVDRRLLRGGEDRRDRLFQRAEAVAGGEAADPGVPLDEVRAEADELGDVRAAGEMVEDVVLEVAGHGRRISRSGPPLARISVESGCHPARR